MKEIIQAYPQLRASKQVIAANPNKSFPLYLYVRVRNTSKAVRGKNNDLFKAYIKTAYSITGSEFDPKTSTNKRHDPFIYPSDRERKAELQNIQRNLATVADRVGVLLNDFDLEAFETDRFKAGIESLLTDVSAIKTSTVDASTDFWQAFDLFTSKEVSHNSKAEKPLRRLRYWLKKFEEHTLTNWTKASFNQWQTVSDFKQFHILHTPIKGGWNESKQGLRPLVGLQPKQQWKADRYFKFDQQDPKRIRTVAQTTIQLRKFLKYLGVDVHQDHLKEMSYEKVARHARKQDKCFILLPDEYQAIKDLTLTPQQKSYGWENARKVMILQYNIGLRISDITSLTKDHLRQSAKGRFFLEVVQEKTGSKTGESVLVLLNADAMQVIQAASEGKADGEHLFTRKANSAYNASHYSDKYKQLAKLARLERIVSDDKQGKKDVPLHTAIRTHILRYTFITNRINQGFTPDQVSLMTGIATSEIIKTHYDQAGTKSKMDRIEQMLDRVGGSKQPVHLIEQADG